MAGQMDKEGFGGCSLFGECQEACPKSISIDSIVNMNRDYIVATASAIEERKGGGDGLGPLPGGPLCTMGPRAVCGVRVSQRDM
jgi:hypothetical protein